MMGYDTLVGKCEHDSLWCSSINTANPMNSGQPWIKEGRCECSRLFLHRQVEKVSLACSSAPNNALHLRLFYVLRSVNTPRGESGSPPMEFQPSAFTKRFGQAIWIWGSSWPLHGQHWESQQSSIATGLELSDWSHARVLKDCRPWKKTRVSMH